LTNRVISTISVGYTIYGIAVNPKTNKIYVANGVVNSIFVIDSSSGARLANVPMPYVPFGVAVNPNTNMVYVTSLGTEWTTIIDASTNTLVTSIAIPEFPGATQLILSTLLLLLAVTVSRGRRKPGRSVPTPPESAPAISFGHALRLFFVDAFGGVSKYFRTASSIR
jgi:YVTN family beta-propeller protein